MCCLALTGVGTCTCQLCGLAVPTMHGACRSHSTAWCAAYLYGLHYLSSIMTPRRPADLAVPPHACRYFARIADERMGPEDQCILVTHQPRWLADWFWDEMSCHNLRQLVRGHLRGRARVHLAGRLCLMFGIAVDTGLPCERGHGRWCGPTWWRSQRQAIVQALCNSPSAGAGQPCSWSRALLVITCLWGPASGVPS